MGIRDNIAKRFQQIAAAITSDSKRLTWMQAKVREPFHGSNLNLNDTGIQGIPGNLKESGKIYPESLTHELLPQITPEDLAIPGKAKELYESVSHRLDPDGFVLFHEAEDILGKLDFSSFAYEDNLGRFEEANGYDLLKYLLVDHCNQLGKANIGCDRWEVVKGTPYEKCINLSIDKTTPEYRQFKETLYRNVCKKLGVLKEPSEKTLEEKAPKVSALDALEANAREHLRATPQPPAPTKMPPLEH